MITGRVVPHPPAMDVTAPSLSALVPGASALSPDLLTAIARVAICRDVVAGTDMLRQHDLVRELTVLVSGRISTLVEFAGTGALIVESTTRPGRIFGWSGLRAPHRATATVRAEDPCRVLVLPLEPLLGDRPRWRAALCALVAAGLADRTRQLQTSGPVGAVVRGAAAVDDA